ncbi:lytic transglycosylase domain-containing protein [Streptomyces sp. NPDC000229]|uniref:lytic transglycosylase domain-containing protein n=1 Tax=Streptomyces sp. NPDC000229 TaxID=3154247 RepID=UPI0040384CC6
MRSRSRARRGVTGTAAAVAAMAALTASQAPGFTRSAVPVAGEPAAGDPVMGGLPWAAVPGPRDDGAYHTELPPLTSPAPSMAPAARPGGTPLSGLVTVHAGIPATVLAAYRRAEAAVARTDPGCRLPWQLLAAIGKVESGQARGGRVDAHGSTLEPILGPVLNGVGFARITDTDGGAYDGDTVYDRAVGPMQFIPSTWARWRADGNGDGRQDPGNVHDAALAAGRYLCAGERTLTVKADLDRAVLGYNHSGAYLRTVLAWLAFYQRGAHPVPDTTGVLPVSPGAGHGGNTGSGKGTKPSPSPSGGIVVGPQPSTRPSAVPGPPARPTRPPVTLPPRPSPSPPPAPTPPTPTPTKPIPSTPPAPTPSPSPSTTPTPTPAPTQPSPDPTCPSPPPAPTGTPSPAPAPGPTVTPTGAPCSTPAPLPAS